MRQILTHTAAVAKALKRSNVETAVWLNSNSAMHCFVISQNEPYSQFSIDQTPAFVLPFATFVVSHTHARTYSKLNWNISTISNDIMKLGSEEGTRRNPTAKENERTKFVYGACLFLYLVTNYNLSTGKRDPKKNSMKELFLSSKLPDWKKK